ncbi:zinc-binding protein A33-like [Pristis pectinata]|uniref:zinc-binding protein A33-like n=1 Tax=Pristis pectinata TaxID=685728 RepID=UPI00223E233C|nr:zinc-binding protein A33-like [Pristis pectinata]
MASNKQVRSLADELICPICLDFFTDPVILECGHNFCRSCITRCWEGTGKHSCPDCRAVFVDPTFRASRALASLAKKAQSLILNPKEKESKLHCEQHHEELKLFCETDKKLICVICAAAREHREHRFSSIKEAVEACKVQMKSSVESLTRKLQEMEHHQKLNMSGLREQSSILHLHITSEFAKMHQILTKKEERLLRELREEEERIQNTMEKNLRAIQENLHSTQRKLSKLQKQMNQEDGVMFLKEESRQQKRISDEEQALSVADDVQQIAKFDHPFLFHAALREMFDAINQVSVTLDVETAGPLLEVSEDLKSVKWTGIRRILPDTGKRFTTWPYVLGSEAFTSGRHYWEVEVEGNWGWCLGVAAGSVERKREVKLRPETGLWAMERAGDEIYANTSPPSLLPADSIFGKVGVYLRYESGSVSFYSADTKTHLYTFTGNKFTEKLYPFFGTWDKNQCLRIRSRSALVL